MLVHFGYNRALKGEELQFRMVSQLLNMTYNINHHIVGCKATVVRD